MMKIYKIEVEKLIPGPQEGKKVKAVEIKEGWDVKSVVLLVCNGKELAIVINPWPGVKEELVKEMEEKVEGKI